MKLQQYLIFKFNSSRLKNSNYKIKLNIRDARKNGEIVSIGESQMTRSLFKILGKDKEESLTNLFKDKNEIKKQKSSSGNIVALTYLENRIDEYLFIPEICSVVIEHNKHYQHIIDNGFVVNGKKFVRLLCGSGQSRRNTVFFIEDRWELPLKIILNNGRNEAIEISPAKFNAYFALCASATIPVSEPYFCVVPDCVVRRNEQVEFIDERSIDDEVVEKSMLLDFNLFDGMGLISPRQAQTWASELELDYIPSTFIVRNSFMKGMVCVFDFHEFALLHDKKYFKDVWGNNVNVLDVDVIISESQLKLWNTFASHSQYVDNCRANGLTWGISRFAPKEDSKYIFSNYQFLQVEHLDDNQIEKLCSKTVEYFNNIIRDDIDFTLLYLLGKNTSCYDNNLLDKINDPVSKALILNNKLINDPYVHSHIVKSINKKIRESYIGNLLLDGNYEVMISDPYAMAEHIFNMPVRGLLDRGEHYAHYWNELNVDRVAAYRAPLTWKSEVNILNLKRNENIDFWYKYIHSGIIYNIHGADDMLHADADRDGDLVMTTNQPELIEGAYGGLPITYNKNKVPKAKIEECELYKSDMKSFNTRIGFITNCSTTLYAMLLQFEKNSKEYSEIIKRLKICRKEQGNQIDKAKGLIVKPFPLHWTKWSSLKGELSDEDRKNAEFNNRILIDKRPYFMRYLYSNYNREYVEYNNNFDNFCIANFNLSLKELLDKKELNEKESETLSKYYHFNPLLDTNCVMNKICHHMERNVKQLKESNISKATDENIVLLKSHEIPFDDIKFKRLYDLYKKYKNGKQNFAAIKDDNGEDRFKTADQYNKSVRQEAYAISSNIQELANLAVSICYEAHPSDNKSFAWNVFGEGIVQNVLANKQDKVCVPFLDVDGEISYLGNKYSKQIIGELDDVNFL